MNREEQNNNLEQHKLIRAAVLKLVFWRNLHLILWLDNVKEGGQLI